MNPQKTSGIFIVILTALFLLVGPSTILAQAAGAQPPGTQTSQPPSTVTSEASVSNQTLTGASELRPVYGLQGVLVETLGGKTVASQSSDEPFNPASAIKLATALIALQTFGPKHRFTTGIWTEGTLDRTSGTIHGNLYVSGGDPSFHYEHGMMIARRLNDLGIRTVTGDLVIAPGFTMNFNSSARRSGEQLFETLDSKLRSAEATGAWTYERTALGDRASLHTVPSMVVMGGVQVNSVPLAAKLLLTHKSSPLADILKVLLCYSNNFMAERIGEHIGGMESVRRQLLSTLGIAPNELMLSSLSGLGVNRITPHAMMKIFRALRDELQKNKLSPSDILPVAGIDPGTLQDRFADLARRGSVIAKTGTLTRTDGGASSLVGQMKTADGEILLFVIMNQQGSILRFRENQDYLVTQVQNTRGGPKAFNYKPLTLTMRLADTESTFTATGDEYEPGLKVVGSSP